MLLSYDPAFLFIHIDKAAGSSIQSALGPVAPVTRNSRFRRRMVWLGALNRSGLYRSLEFPEHTTAHTVRQCLPPEVYGGLFKFAFVRNPWDRLVSRYAYLLRSSSHPRHDTVSRMKGFEEYLKWQIRRGKFYQHPYVTDSNGRRIVDFIGYFERLPEDFATVCDRLGIRADLPRVNTSPHPDYRSYFTSATRDLVAMEFRRDIELFGYTFDGIKAE